MMSPVISSIRRFFLRRPVQSWHSSEAPQSIHHCRFHVLIAANDFSLCNSCEYLHAWLFPMGNHVGISPVPRHSVDARHARDARDAKWPPQVLLINYCYVLYFHFNIVCHSQQFPIRRPIWDRKFYSYRFSAAVDNNDDWSRCRPSQFFLGFHQLPLVVGLFLNIMKELSIHQEAQIKSTSSQLSLLGETANFAYFE